MLKQNILLLLLFLNVSLIVNGQRIKSFVSVIKLLPDQEIPTNSVVYYLPKTIVKIDVLVKKSVYKAGMFSAYSDNLLNISPIVSKDSVRWDVVEIKISTIGEADKQKRYAITAGGDASAQFISLAADGRLLGFNYAKKVENEQMLDYKVESELTFDDISFSAVPFLEKQLKTTSLPAMASSSAEMIYKLRKRQLKLAGFEYEHHPSDMDLMNYSLLELQRQEQMFEELFVGKSESQLIMKTFFVESDRLNANLEPLFNFSSSFGFIEADEIISERYFFKSSGFNNALSNKTINKSSKAKCGVVYNIAETVSIHLIKDSTEVFVKKIQVASKENTADISPKILTQKDLSIEFDDKTGALKSITKK